MHLIPFFYSQLVVRPTWPTRSFEGETVIVTGANVGLGLEAARHIARLGAARVILGVRNVKAGEEAKQSIETSTGRPGVCEVWEVDLASYKSVLAFGDRAAQLPRLDAAILNAAVATPNFQLDEGYERTITVNVINTLLLGLLILPPLKATRKSLPSTHPRLSFIVSEVHGLVEFPEWKEESPLKTISDPAKAKMDVRYPLSKLLEVLLVQELAARVRASDVIITMVNPGLCHSQLGREAGWGLWAMKQVLARTTEVGSRTLVAGVSTGIEGHGSYMTDGHVSNTSLSAYVRSEEGGKAREKLWEEVIAVLEAERPGIIQNI
ncbi:Short-chain dehydrogenase/reductase family protein [Penicillium hispanicum]|uniref:Short-chain dehydrogenase/reductase family protein n=1 Tax=Penicillium hispanicum TaxID=1080232 RepID=UPI002540C7C9|nr:Short-chain dehydrogenase/reductase family protein [Penicillium hispanicum]KAJ5584763.1 Short-chain dehydrogenase/reductase family protein [Penicillium hispanicum]